MEMDLGARGANQRARGRPPRPAVQSEGREAELTPPPVFAAKRPRGDAGGRGVGVRASLPANPVGDNAGVPHRPSPRHLLVPNSRLGAAACLPGPDPQSQVLLRLAPWGLQAREWACSAMGRGVGGGSCGRLGAARCRR